MASELGLRIVRETGDAAALIRWLGDQPFVGIDTETTGFDLWEPEFKVRLVQIASPDMAWIVEPDQWRGLLNEMVGFPGRLVFHNARYDITALDRAGVVVPWVKAEDTMIAMKIAEPHLSAELKEAATRHVSPAAKAGQAALDRAMKRNRWTWATVPIDLPVYLYYAALDAVLTARLFTADVCRRTVGGMPYRLEMDVLAICAVMEATGVRTDQGHCYRERDRLLAVVTEGMTEGAGRFGLSITSPDQVARWMIGSAARPYLTKLTPGGAPAVDDEVLSRVEAELPGTEAADLARLTRTTRKALKLANTYFNNLIGLADDEGVVHPEVRTMGARTGRMSMTPGLQTLPKPSTDPDSQTVRRAILPRREGEVLVSADLDQVEMRIAAALSGDAGLIKAFAEADAGGEDFFTLSARELYRDPLLARTDPRRKLVKSMWYGALYGAGAAKMAATAGVPVARMVDLRDRIGVMYPGFWKLGREAQAEARANDGWVEIPYGRKLRVNKLYVATNYIVQGGAAVVFKRGLVNLAQAGLAPMLSLVVHDEVLLSVPESEVPEVRVEVERALRCDDFSVPLTAHASGPMVNWADGGET